ncbi:Hypothetical_protein [Hexamita inflata]|uniref:Hypothetical_protein n=1 Tax=Hexamita inflata TaxID=28002 RepID=A0AA86QPD4_9EUKA|nr:Hypothetical protein HINF_LOCUS45353 [Hexamita inflata]
MVELTNIDNVTQPECKTLSSRIEWEEFLNKCVEDHVTSIQHSENIRDEYWILYTEVMHPGVYVSQPAELTFILEEISKNQFKNIDNAVKYLKTLSDQIIQLENLICSHISVFDFVFSYVYEVIVEIFNKSNTNMSQIIKLLCYLNKIDEAIELVNQSQSLLAYQEFLNYLNLTYDNCGLSLAKYKLFISNFYLIFQDNLPNLDFHTIFSTMFVYHLMLYGTEQINISFDPNIKLYIGKHTNNIVQILDYATQLQVVILSQSYNKYVDYFISQQNEVSQLGLTCFQIAIKGGNTEMIIKFQDQIKTETYHITSLMLLMTTYQEIYNYITHEQIKLLFQHFSFSLSNDMLFLGTMLQQQTNLKPIQSCLKNSFNELRGFSCYDFAINFMKIQQEKDFKKVDYFFKPIIAGERFADISLYLGGPKMSIHFNTLEYRFKTLWASPWRKQSESTTPQMENELQNSHNFL